MHEFEKNVDNFTCNFSFCDVVIAVSRGALAKWGDVYYLYSRILYYGLMMW